jgi:Predicted membrane protein
VSVLLKGAHALVECVGGLVLALVSTATIANWVNVLTQEELIEDPQDFIAGFLLTQAQNFSVGTKNFYAFYLLSHGIVKLLLVIGLLRNKLWSYPASLVVFGLFILYQLYRFSYTYSAGLIALTVLDLVVIWLIWREYKIVRRHRPTA